MNWPWLARVAVLALALQFGACAIVRDPMGAQACALESNGAAKITMLRNVPLVAASVDGQPVSLVLDTGSETSFLTAAAADRLGLKRDGAPATRAQGVGGTSLNFNVRAKVFRVGDAALPGQVFNVGSLNWHIDGAPPDGFLGTDVLARFDIDLNLPEGVVSFYRARPCDTATPPWDEPYAVLPLRPSPAGLGLFSVPMRLNGQTVSATLDTGAEFTTVAMSTARALGITSANLGRDPPLSVFGFGPNLQISRIHRFDEMAIGDDVERDVRLVVADLPPLSGDLLLGSSFLMDHRVYLSYATQRIFISRPGAPGAVEARAAPRR
jgi:predicted aspartyl protease